MGTILSCLPGCLAFVETEDERFILERNDPLERREFLRFVVDRKDEDSHVEQGIFQAAALALEWENIKGSDADKLNELRAWFSENLEKPNSFGRGKLALASVGSRLVPPSTSLASTRCPASSNAAGICVKKIKTDKPGYVVYEDEWQLVAEPFRKGTLPERDSAFRRNRCHSPARHPLGACSDWHVVRFSYPHFASPESNPIFLLGRKSSCP